MVKSVGRVWADDFVGWAKGGKGRRGGIVGLLLNLEWCY